MLLSDKDIQNYITLLLIFHFYLICETSKKCYSKISKQPKRLLTVFNGWIKIYHREKFHPHSTSNTTKMAIYSPKQIKQDAFGKKGYLL